MDASEFKEFIFGMLFLKRLAAALDRNLQLWVGIRTVVDRDDNLLPVEVKENLSRLSYFVAQKTFEMQNGSNDKTHRKLQYSYTLFGREYEHWQSIFFCIAAHSVSAGTLLSKFKEIVEGRSLQVHERVDTFVALHATDNQNILLNGALEDGTDIPRDKSINFLPYPGSSICTYRATEPWSLFVMLLLLLQYMVQVPTEPVNMLLYSGNDPY